MEEEDKLPLKRVELSLIKFNEVAIPHHLDLLRQHKANIIKHEARGALAAARGEQRGARRVAARLRALLLEMEALRAQVRAAERARFDALTQRSRDTTLRAIVDYLGSSPLEINQQPDLSEAAAASAASTDSVGVVAHAAPGALPFDPHDQIQLLVDDQELALRQRSELLVGWRELQAEVRALHEVWQRAQAAALQQRADVARADRAAHSAAHHVAAARRHLAAAHAYGGAWSAGGALCGAALGGPLGLALGAKAGALAAAAGSLLGYLAVRVARRPPPPPPPRDKDA